MKPAKQTTAEEEMNNQPAKKKTDCKKETSVFRQTAIEAEEKVLCIIWGMSFTEKWIKCPQELC